MKLSSLALLLAALAAPVFVSISLRAQAAAPGAAAPAKMGSMVYDWEKLAVRTTANGERRNVGEQPTRTIETFESHITTLNPDQFSHPPHKHAQEELIILKEGTLDVIINGKTQRVSAGSMFFFASNDMHNVHNVGGTRATYWVFNFKTAATQAAPAEGAAAAALPGKLPSSVYDWEKLTVKPTATGERRDVLNSPTVTLANFEAHITTLKPGEAPHAAHRHPDEELVVVKEGTIEVSINGEKQRAGAGSIFFYGSNDEHGMKNVGTTNATYFVIRVVTEATPKA